MRTIKIYKQIQLSNSIQIQLHQMKNINNLKIFSNLSLQLHNLRFIHQLINIPIQQFNTNLHKFSFSNFLLTQPFRHCIEHKFLNLLFIKLSTFKYNSEIVKTVFCNLQYLLKAITQTDQLIYIIVTLNKQGYLQHKYIQKFQQQQDSAYYANFLKILIKKINEDIKFLSIFFNNKQPHFPLLLNLLKLYTSHDLIVKTSMKLTLIQICSNKTSYKPIKNFISNFPFIILYSLTVYEIYNSMKQAVETENQIKIQNSYENMRNQIKFMQDFLIKQDKLAIQMYTNAFMTIIGKYIYQELKIKSKKNQNKIKKILTIIDKVLINQITILKIRIGLFSLFQKNLTKQLKSFLNSKEYHLELNYWLIDECPNQINEHCLQIYLQSMEHRQRYSSTIKTQSKSFIKSFNSYIPRTKQNWLYHQLRKISHIIGFEIELNKIIERQSKYLEGTYLSSVQKINHLQDNYFNQNQINDVYEKFVIYQQENEEILYYFLKIYKKLKIPQIQPFSHELETDEIKLFLDLLLPISKVTSMSVLLAFYQLLPKQHHLQIDENLHPQAKEFFDYFLQKLLYYIITEGWSSFYNRAKIQVSDKLNIQFSPDIFRDLQCDILYFVILRQLLGTINSDCDDEANISLQFLKKDIQSKQIKTHCLLVDDEKNLKEQIEIILDGIYIKLLNKDEKMINKQSLKINSLYIYQNQQKKILEIITKQSLCQQKQQYFCIQFTEKALKQCIWKQIKWRKQILMEIELKLKYMWFPFVQKKQQK